MTTTTTKAPKLTNAKAMAVLVDVFVNGTSADAAIAKIDGGAFDKATFDEKVTHMLATALKPAAKSNAPTKAAIANESRARAFAAEFDGESFTSRDVQIHFGFTNASAATAVIVRGINLNIFEKAGYDGSRAIYKLAE